MNEKKFCSKEKCFDVIKELRIEDGTTAEEKEAFCVESC